MKKLIYLFFIVCLFCGCSESDPVEQTQDYTSFIIWHNEPITLINSVAGYFDSEGYCHKIDALGDLTQGKYSKEIIVTNDTLRYVYIFSDYPLESYRTDTVFILKKNTKNIFEITRNTHGMRIDKNDPKQYPY